MKSLMQKAQKLLHNRVKRNIMTNDDAMLDVLSKNMKGAKGCPLMGMHKCVGEYCELFKSFKNVTVNEKTGEVVEMPYHNCAFSESVNLQIEINRNLRALNDSVQQLNNNIQSLKGQEGG